MHQRGDGNDIMYDSRPARAGLGRFVFPFLAAVAMIATPASAASLGCTRVGDTATCSYAATQEELNATAEGYMYIVEQNTGVQAPNLTALTGLEQLTGVADFCTNNPGDSLIFHLRDGFSGADFAGNVESTVSCAAVPPPPPPPPPATGGASGMLQTITDGATGFFWSNIPGVLIAGIVLGILLGLLSWLKRSAILHNKWLASEQVRLAPSASQQRAFNRRHRGRY